MNKLIVVVCVGMWTLASGSAAEAHVGVSSGPGFANATQEIVFGVGHGCEGADTLSVKIDIPAVVTSIRALNSDLGRAVVEKNPAGAVTAVSWQKPDAELVTSDVNYYKLTLRMKVPDQPFTTLFFVVHQTCKSSTGTVKTVDWISTEKTPPMGVEPAAALKIMPARQLGWNKLTVPADMDDLSVYFSDAQIVWRGESAFSANKATAEQIANTTGVSPLTALSAGDEIWVRY